MAKLAAVTRVHTSFAETAPLTARIFGQSQSVELVKTASVAITSPDLSRIIDASLEEEATMLKFTTSGHRPRPPPEWFKANILAQIHLHRVTDTEQEEEHCLEAMLHWRDPVRRLRMLRCRRHTLVDDNPASG
jgi:hypothetical protein